MVEKTGQQWTLASDGGWWLQPGWMKRKDAQVAMHELLALPLAERNVAGLGVLKTKQGRYTVHAARVRHKGLWYGKGANPGDPFMNEVLIALSGVAIELKQIEKEAPQWPINSLN